MILIGDLMFNTPAQGAKLPQQDAGAVYCSNYFFTGAIGGAVTNFQQNIFTFANSNTFNLLGLELNCKVLTAAGAFVSFDYAQLSFFGSSIDIPIPYPIGMEPVQSSYVLQIAGNVNNKPLKTDFGSGYQIQPGSDLAATVDLYKAAAFGATDVFSCTLKMYWSL